MHYVKCQVDCVRAQHSIELLQIHKLLQVSGKPHYVPDCPIHNMILNVVDLLEVLDADSDACVTAYIDQW